MGLLAISVRTSTGICRSVHAASQPSPVFSRCSVGTLSDPAASMRGGARGRGGWSAGGASRMPSSSCPGTAAARSSRPRPGSAVGGRSTAPEPGGDGGGVVSGEGGLSWHRERRWRRKTPPHAVIADTHRRRGEEN
uniref:Uncharacterized protein n=1 Tax=Oryza glumipatula TaxID=40148 RepID=A0A0E0AIC4_9ORYZ